MAVNPLRPEQAAQHTSVTALWQALSPRMTASCCGCGRPSEGREADAGAEVVDGTEKKQEAAASVEKAAGWMLPRGPHLNI